MSSTHARVFNPLPLLSTQVAANLHLGNFPDAFFNQAWRRHLKWQTYRILLQHTETMACRPLVLAKVGHCRCYAPRIKFPGTLIRKYEKKKNMFHNFILASGLLASASAHAASFSNSPVPEPETISLMLFGMGVIGVIVFRQK